MSDFLAGFLSASLAYVALITIFLNVSAAYAAYIPGWFRSSRTMGRTYLLAIGLISVVSYVTVMWPFFFDSTYLSLAEATAWEATPDEFKLVMRAGMVAMTVVLFAISLIAIKRHAQSSGESR